MGLILIPLIYVKENDVLGKSLIDKDHQVLLKKGMTLKKNQIKKLMELGYNNLYIASSVDYEPEEFLDSVDRDVLMKKFRSIFMKMRKICEYEQKRSRSRNTSHIIKLEEEKTNEIREVSRDVVEIVGNIMSSKKDYIDYVTIKNHTNYPYHHAIDTGILATLIGKKLNMNARQLVDIFMASIVSELGNACLPPKLLNKKGKLESFEFELIKQHPENGYNTAKGCTFLSHSVKLICLEHHERIDGNGYPNKLIGNEIDIKARVLAVADAYDSLTSSRTYRPPYPPHKALTIISSEVGKSYEGDVVGALYRIIVPYPIGSVVKLNTKELGLVIGIHRDIPERPVLITTNTMQPKKVDLKIETTVEIVGLNYGQ